jgi:flagellar biosynthetic protein FlhB
MSGGEKTEKATPKKLKESRKEGRVARTQDLGAWASVLVVGASMNVLARHGLDKVRELLAETFQAIATPDTAHATALLGSGARLAFMMALTMGCLVMVVGVGSAVAQGGLFFATKAVKPSLKKLDPVQGVKRLFGPHALWEGAKMLLKSSLVAYFVWRAIRNLMPIVGGLVPLDTALQLSAQAATGLMRDVAAAGLVAAAADYAMQRRKTGKQVRMTKEEVKQEHKQSEGDPHLKGAIRSRQLAAARNRMMADIQDADVVLVNPTHIAVALRYDPAQGSPRVVAKGAGAIATRIREVAAEHRVAIVSDVPLARALHFSCEVGQSIPPELYHAVAQVLAYVMSRKARGASAGHHASPRDGAPLPALQRAGRKQLRAPAGQNSSGGPAQSR